MTRSRILASALLVLLLAPAAASTWRVQGSAEPDTPQDKGWVWTDAHDGTGGDRVYFNAVPVVTTLTIRAFLHVGTPQASLAVVEGSRLAPPRTYEVVAFLGVWRDCNGDAYVGHLNGALLEYPSGLLEDASRCPDGSPFHQDKWVTEFLWIRPDKANEHNSFYNATRRPPRVVEDPEANVWGDFGLPGAAGAFTCPGSIPHGSTKTTGGLLGFADCKAGYFVAHTVNDDVDSDGSKGLRFQDPYHPEEDCKSHLNQAFPLWHNPHACPGARAGLLDPDAGRPAFGVWDCDAGGAPVHDPTGLAQPIVVPPQSVAGVTYGGSTITPTHPDGRFFTIPTGTDPFVDPDGSVAEGIQKFKHDGITTCPDWAPSLRILGISGVNPAGHFRNYTSAKLENQSAPPDPRTGKRGTDFSFVFDPDVTTTHGLIQGYVGRWLTRLVLGDDVDPGPDALNATWGDAPGYSGATPLQMARGGGWRSTGPAHGPPNYWSGLLTRDMEPAGGVHTTFYARLGPTTLALYDAPTGPHAYGVEACPRPSPTVHNGWMCDPDLWWVPQEGGPSPVPETRPARLHDVYHLRDVDCVDNTLHPDLPAASLAMVGTEPRCPGVDAP